MKKIVVVLALVAVAVGAWLLFRHKSAAAADEETKPVAQIQVAPLQKQEISQTVPAFGVVEAAPTGGHSITLGYDCVVKAIPAGIGSRVAAGDTILEVAPTPDAQMQLDSARSAASLAAKVLDQTKERFDLRLATNQDVLTSQQAAEDAKIKLASLQKRGMSGNGRIAAPEDGIVTKLDWQPGATVPAGTILVVVAGAGHLEAHLAVEASDVSLLQAGQAVTLLPANRPDADPVAATVRLVGASADPATGAVDVRVPLPADSGWFVGERVQGDIEVQKKTALVAPRSAVLPDEDKQILFTVKGDKAVKHEVQTGIASGDLVEVISKDLKPGDSAVSVGNYELEDGMDVQLAGEGKGDEKADDKKPDAKPGAEKAPDEKKTGEKADNPKGKAEAMS